MVSPAALVEVLLDALPQTQCTRCGYADCRGYAEAIVTAGADVNRCPPGGQEGVERLAQLSGRPALPLDPACGDEGPRARAVVDEGWCIGCALCLKACPVDAIVGAAKRMHTVIDDLCTGCELCIPVCPVDCISLVEMTGTRGGWDAWSAAQADEARVRYALHAARFGTTAQDDDESEVDAAPSAATTAPPKRETIAAALAAARSRSRRAR
jgi:Na+-translocating ferredoxin:NAD+ oxidoreductase subunit B